MINKVLALVVLLFPLVALLWALAYAWGWLVLLMIPGFAIALGITVGVCEVWCWALEQFR